MQNAIELLRGKFEASTNISVNDSSIFWKQYALWLEQMNISDSLNDLIKENCHIKKKIDIAMDALYKAISERY